MAGKRKNAADNWMPSRVFRGPSAYNFKHPDGRTIRLCALNATQAEVWVHYEKFINEKKDKSTLTILVESFFRSVDFIDLATETQKDYRKYASKLLPVFGAMHPDNIKPEHVRKYMDKRGLSSRTQANREKTFMSRAYRWGYERGLVKGNPCKGVKQFKEESRERYITDEEYKALYKVAPNIVRAAMEIAYLCLARQADVLSLRKDQFRESGIFIRQGKTGAKQIKEWSQRLRDAIALAESLPLQPGISSVYIIRQRTGLRYTRDGFNSRWRKAKEAAKEAHPELDFNFTFHDLKAKGVSDLEGSLSEKQAISGHRNMGQTARYDRKIKVVPVVGNQKK
ncbi:TPA: tyrosine-type recombinase/integrase [Yersinia enterocolitica]|nr:tyrosine-type recombinase/integrase [Yersinia enterocolitica]